MPYVQRVGGVVVGVYANPQPQPDGSNLAPEFLAADHPDVVAYLNPPPGVPESVAQWQARTALLRAGLLAQVEAAVAQASDEVKIAWEYAPRIRRDSDFTVAIAAALSLSDAQLDALFVTAAEIT
jgi:hypothetical protein